MSDQLLVAIITVSGGIITTAITNWPKRRKKRRSRDVDRTG